MQSTYHITGMTQWSSAQAVAGRLAELPDVEGVRTDIVAGTAQVTSESPLRPEDVAAAIAEAGCALAPPAEPKRASAIVIASLVAALITGFALGKATAPVPSAAAEPVVTPSAHHAGASNADGLAVSNSGYTMVPTASRFDGPGQQQLSFVVKDVTGTAVTRFATVHEKQLHLVVVRRDLTGYQHLHPVMSADGVWTVAAGFDASGPWRVYADFTVINAAFSQVAITVGHDLHVGGSFQPRSLPAQTTAVTYDGTPQLGLSTPLLFGVTGGSLEPYLGSFGHLVVLREADMAYIHVHPEPQLASGKVKFWLTVPSSGKYRMFFDYQVNGQVRTQAFDYTAA